MATLAQDGLAQLLAFDPVALADPVPLYHALRETTPVYRHERATGFVSWHLTRYEDIAAVLKDPRYSSRRDPGANRRREMLRVNPIEMVRRIQFFTRYMAPWMLLQDPPNHTRLRGLVLKAFTPRVVASFRPRIQAIVDELLDRAQAAGEMNVIADLAYPLPATVIAELLGVPAADRDRFHAWSNALVTVQEKPDDRAFAAMRAMVAYMRGIVKERRAEPRDDLISNLIRARQEDRALSEDELLAQCVLLLVAGHETTTNLIGNGLLALLRHPDQLAALRDDPALIESAVEEVLRYDSPVQFTGRVATEERVIGGQTIAAGDRLTLWVGAANHDPAEFPDPDRLDIARAPNRHLSFAVGPHFCVGSALARLEGQIAIGTVLARFPALRLATDTPQWRRSLPLRGLTALPVIFRED